MLFMGFGIVVQIPALVVKVPVLAVLVPAAVQVPVKVKEREKESNKKTDYRGSLVRELLFIRIYKLSQEKLDAFCKEMEVFAQEKHLKTMPEGMIERIAHTPDVEYERPHFAN